MAFAQQKSNFYLNKIVQKKEKTNNKIHLLIQGNTVELSKWIKSKNGDIKGKSGNILSIALPENQIVQLLQNKFLSRVQYFPVKAIPLLDTARILNRVDSIQSNDNLCVTNVDGTGVIVGLIDTGIDFTHPDFKTPSGSTRILYIWDQNASTGGVTPMPYNYGQLWDSAAINANTCTHDGPTNGNHGTDVIGIAAGNGTMKAKYKGVAYNADIIAVEVSEDNDFLTAFVDAVEFIFTKADELGKPCVINSSVGSYLSGHDGNDLYSFYIDYFLLEKNGRALVQAAGNGGAIRFHTQHVSNNTDTIFTWWKFQNNISTLKVFEYYTDTNSISTYQFRLGIDRKTTFVNNGKSNWYDLSSMNLNAGNFNIQDSIVQGGITKARYEIWVEKVDSAVYIAVEFNPNFADYYNYYCRFESNGTAVLDSWSDHLWGLARAETTLPSSATYPDIIWHRTSDINQTIVGFWNCSPNVISVANYQNKNSFTAVDGIYSYFGNVKGKIASSSSLGPTRNGLQKPDLAATGGQTVTAFPHLTWLANYAANDKVNLDSVQYYQINGGTSMAAPQVTGVGALYFQLQPNASAAQLKSALLNNVYTDANVSLPLPNTIWGYGKLNAYKTVESAIIMGCTNTSASNYNANAHCDNGSCVVLPVKWLSFIAEKFIKTQAKLTWITAQEINCKNFEIEYSNDAMTFYTIGILPAKGNSNINTNYSFIHENPINGVNYYRIKQIDINGNFAYSAIRKLVFKSDNIFEIFPQPSDGKNINIKFSEPINDDFTIEIFNVESKLVFSENIKNSLNKLTYNIEANELISGIYFVKINTKNGIIQTKIFIKK